MEGGAGLEDGADGEVGEEAHGEDDPAGDLEGEGAGAGVDAAGVAQDLQDLVGGDKLPQEQQAIQEAPAGGGLLPVLGCSHRSRPLGLGCLSNSQVTRGP